MTEPTAAVNTAVYGTVSEFDGDKEEWDEYTERLEEYTSRLIASLRTLRRGLLVRSLVSPAKPKDLSYEDIVAKVKKHFHPIRSVIVERFNFNSRCQEEGETVATFVAELKKRSELCNYRNSLSDMLRDRIVCGIRDKAVQRRLLAESDLAYLDMAQATEIAKNDSKRING